MSLSTDCEDRKDDMLTKYSSLDDEGKRVFDMSFFASEQEDENELFWMLKDRNSPAELPPTRFTFKKTNAMAVDMNQTSVSYLSKWRFEYDDSYSQHINELTKTAFYKPWLITNLVVEEDELKDFFDCLAKQVAKFDKVCFLKVINKRNGKFGVLGGRPRSDSNEKYMEGWNAALHGKKRRSKMSQIWYKGYDEALKTTCGNP